MSNEPTMMDVLNSLVTSTEKPAELLEVYYWSREEGLPEFIRGILLLPNATRKALMQMLKMIDDKKSLRAELNTDGSVVFGPAKSRARRTRRVA